MIGKNKGKVRKLKQDRIFGDRLGMDKAKQRKEKEREMGEQT